MPRRRRAARRITARAVSNELSLVKAGVERRICSLESNLSNKITKYSLGNIGVVFSVLAFIVAVLTIALIVWQGDTLERQVTELGRQVNALNNQVVALNRQAEALEEQVEKMPSVAPYLEVFVESKSSLVFFSNNLFPYMSDKRYERFFLNLENNGLNPATHVNVNIEIPDAEWLSGHAHNDNISVFMGEEPKEIEVKFYCLTTGHEDCTEKDIVPGYYDVKLSFICAGSCKGVGNNLIVQTYKICVANRDFDCSNDLVGFVSEELKSRTTIFD